jgi:hypothetical protein
LELVSTQTSADGSGLLFSVELDDGEITLPVATQESVDPTFELSLWLGGLNSFLSLSGHIFAEGVNANARSTDYLRHFRLTYSSLLQCARSNTSVRRLVGRGESDLALKLTAADLDELGLILRELLLLNESLVKTRSLGHGDWMSWKGVVTQKLRSSAAFSEMITLNDRRSLGYLPTRLLDVLLDTSGSFAASADIRAMLPQFGGTLRSLNTVGRMLRNDEPLKPALVVFALVYEQARDLVTFINNRLARYTDEKSDLFGLLDGASYTVAMELKKVYDEELKGVIGIRPAPLVYAKFEAAYSLLTESLQQLLASFARLSDPSLKAVDFFPNFGEKLDNSLVLRAEMWKVLQAVRTAERSPEKQPLDAVRKVLTHFLEGSLRFLFYKDTETFERFCEEIFTTEDKKDLVPVLHRFGAYLETLFGQINMRAVLADRPFQPDTGK